MNLSRNIALDCGHDEALATLAKDEKTAWCPICEAQVGITHIAQRGNDDAGDA